jgi:two-component system, NarL family, nitrate/nitrite response regulator NarL
VDPIVGREVNKIRVLLADNSRIHTQLLSDALNKDPSLEVINWDWDPSGLIPTALAQNVDILAISSGLRGPAADAFEVVRELRAVIPGTKVVVLLESPKDEDVVNAFRAGAKGIFNRESSVEMFCKCIHRVHEGEVWADRRSVSLAIDALASTPVVRAVGKGGLNLLSKRELQVVQCLVQGLSNREIADQMGLSQHTIKNYLFRVFDKLGVSSRTELLYMTLSQSITPEDAFLAESKKAFEDKNPSEASLRFLEKAAEDGLPAAQLTLAQLYMARRARPEDLVQAYMWYLIATERTSHARVIVTRMLTAKQIEEAQKKASGWLARRNQKLVSTRESTASNLNFG